MPRSSPSRCCATVIRAATFPARASARPSLTTSRCSTRGWHRGSSARRSVTWQPASPRARSPSCRAAPISWATSRTAPPSFRASAGRWRRCPAPRALPPARSGDRAWRWRIPRAIRRGPGRSSPISAARIRSGGSTPLPGTCRHARAHGPRRRSPETPSPPPFAARSSAASPIRSCPNGRASRPRCSWSPSIWCGARWGSTPPPP